MEATYNVYACYTYSVYSRQNSGYGIECNEVFAIEYTTICGHRILERPEYEL